MTAAHDGGGVPDEPGRRVCATASARAPSAGAGGSGAAELRDEVVDESCGQLLLGIHGSSELRPKLGTQEHFAGCGKPLAEDEDGVVQEKVSAAPPEIEALCGWS